MLRPDSGDAVQTVVMGLRAAEEVFGCDVNQKGFKVPRGCSVIQGSRGFAFGLKRPSAETFCVQVTASTLTPWSLSSPRCTKPASARKRLASGWAGACCKRCARTR